MSLPFDISDTSPFIHFDPLTRWTSAYASAGDGKGDQTYHQAGVAMAGIDFNITGAYRLDGLAACGPAALLGLHQACARSCSPSAHGH